MPGSPRPVRAVLAVMAVVGVVIASVVGLTSVSSLASPVGHPTRSPRATATVTQTVTAYVTAFVTATATATATVTKTVTSSPSSTAPTQLRADQLRADLSADQLRADLGADEHSRPWSLRQRDTRRAGRRRRCRWMLPGPTTTGPNTPASMLPVYTGSCTITAPNTVIDEQDRQLQPARDRQRGASGLVIKNSRVNGGVIQESGSTSFTIQDSTLDNAGSTTPPARRRRVVHGGQVRVRRPQQRRRRSAEYGYRNFTVLRTEIVGTNRGGLLRENVPGPGLLDPRHQPPTGPVATRRTRPRSGVEQGADPAPTTPSRATTPARSSTTRSAAQRTSNRLCRTSRRSTTTPSPTT